MQRGMVIDLRRFTGCYGCVIACKAEPSTPPGIHFRRMRIPAAKSVPMEVAC